MAKFDFGSINWTECGYFGLLCSEKLFSYCLATNMSKTVGKRMNCARVIVENLGNRPFSEKLAP